MGKPQNQTQIYIFIGILLFYGVFLIHQNQKYFNQNKDSENTKFSFTISKFFYHLTFPIRYIQKTIRCLLCYLKKFLIYLGTVNFIKLPYIVVKKLIINTFDLILHPYFIFLPIFRFLHFITRLFIFDVGHECMDSGSPFERLGTCISFRTSLYVNFFTKPIDNLWINIINQLSKRPYFNFYSTTPNDNIIDNSDNTSNIQPPNRDNQSENGESQKDNEILPPPDNQHQNDKDKEDVEIPPPTSTPKPTDSVTPTPHPTPKPTITPKPTQKPTPTPKPTQKPTPTPTPKPTATPTPKPTATPTTKPTPTPTPSPTPKPTEKPTPTPVATPETDIPNDEEESDDYGDQCQENCIKQSLLNKFNNQYDELYEKAEKLAEIAKNV